MAEKVCKDCKAEGITTKRPASYVGPRCFRHFKAHERAQKAARHEKYVQTAYGLAEGDYSRLHAFQEGTCAICRRANGKSRRLSVDHDHDTGWVRGLLCRPCNDLLGHARDDIEFFQRAIEYLLLPPARRAGVNNSGAEVLAEWHIAASDITENQHTEGS